MALRLNGSTSGYVELEAPATAGSNTLVLPNGNGTSGQYLQTNGSGALSWATVGSTDTNLTRGTAITASTGSPTDIDIDLSSLPTDIRRITLLLEDLSTNGNSRVVVRLGTGGTPATTGYAGTVTQGTSTEGMDTAFEFDIAITAAATRITTMLLHNIDGNHWVMSATTGRQDGPNVSSFAGGRVDLGGALDIIRITTLAGTNTFDSGTINIFYEVE